MSDDASPRRRFPRIAILLVLALLAAGGLWFAFGRGEAAQEPVATWTVRREPLLITVTEGGSLQALKSLLISSKVEGEAKILSIVPEGTYVSPEDVERGRVLVELDSSDLSTKLNRQQIAVSEADSGMKQATAAVAIQKNQNDSDLRKADLDVAFARLDLDKYLGAEVAKKAAAFEKDATDESARVLVEEAAIGGQALQSLRKLRSDIDLATEEVKRAESKLQWTEKLLEKGYVSKEEHEADRLALKRQQVSLEQANTAEALFKTYEFLKQVRTLQSALLESLESKRRTEERAKSALAQAEAQSRERDDKLRLEQEQLKKLEAQAKSCVIRATSPGLVVYASSEDRGGYMGDTNPIQEGTTVRERQAIISIPDPTSMGVRVNVHESAMDKVKLGQTARVRIDAFADRPLVGKVVRLSTLPNAANRWQNPDLKVYSTDVAIENAPGDLRPGMSARVEIQVAELLSVLAVPLQAIASVRGKPVVHVRADGRDTPRPVVLGLSNERLVEVKDGLSEGDLVLLAPPKEPPRSEGPQKGGAAPGTPGAPAGTTPAGAPGPGGKGGRGKGTKGGGAAPTGTDPAAGLAPVGPSGGSAPKGSGG